MLEIDPPDIETLLKGIEFIGLQLQRIADILEDNQEKENNPYRDAK